METSHLLLVIVGDLDPTEVRDLVTNSIGKLPRGTYKSEPMPQLTFDKSTVEITPRALPTNYIQGFLLLLAHVTGHLRDAGCQLFAT